MNKTPLNFNCQYTLILILYKIILYMILSLYKRIGIICLICFIILRWFNLCYMLILHYDVTLCRYCLYYLMAWLRYICLIWHNLQAYTRISYNNTLYFYRFTSVLDNLNSVLGQYHYMLRHVYFVIRPAFFYF